MLNFLPLKLSIVPDAWRLFSIRKRDKNFSKFSSIVFKRDDNTCQFCGFQATKYMDVINIDSNYYDNKISNMATACCFCTQCFFLEMAGKNDYGGGYIIYFPEMTQGELNGFCHVLFCTLFNATTYNSDAKNIYHCLKLRASVVEKFFGEGTSDPNVFCRVLLDAPNKKLKNVTNKILSPLRFLPSYSKFKQQIGDLVDIALYNLSSTT